jgi:hypothetical protein
VNVVFEEWQGVADAEAAWKKDLASGPKDNHAWLAKFLAKAEAVDDNETSYSSYSLGVSRVASGMRALAQQMRGQIAKGAHTEASARSLIEHNLAGDLARSAALATNAGKADLAEGAGK